MSRDVEKIIEEARKVLLMSRDVEKIIEEARKVLRDQAAYNSPEFDRRSAFTFEDGKIVWASLDRLRGALNDYDRKGVN